MPAVEVTLTLALLSTTFGAVLLYLASPNQRLRPRRLPTATTGFAATLLALALVAWIAALGAMAGFFAWLTALMLAWVGLPYLSALWPRRDRR